MIPEGKAETPDERAKYDEKCVANLKEIFELIRLHEHQSGGVPGLLRSISSLSLMAEDKNVFVCPAETGNGKPTKRKKDQFRTSYQLVRLAKGADAGYPPSSVALVYEKRNLHAGGRFVLFRDGSVERLSEEEFAALRKAGFRRTKQH